MAIPEFSSVTQTLLNLSTVSKYPVLTSTHVNLKKFIAMSKVTLSYEKEEKAILGEFSIIIITQKLSADFCRLFSCIYNETSLKEN